MQGQLNGIKSHKTYYESNEFEITCEIWGFHGGEDDDVVLTDFGAV
jgi:hypothetical protein